jgi:4-hydroxy-tetrahydrodipicolinate reductase
VRRVDRAISGYREESGKVTRVVSFGLGPIGLGIAESLLDREDVEMIGAIDASDSLAGKDLGHCLSREATGTVIVQDPAIVLNGGEGGVVVHATSSRLADILPQLETIVGFGWNVLSTCEELTYPAVADPALAAALDRMASKAGVTVLGAGVNPGFLMDALPLFLSAVCLRVDSILVRRVVDTNQRRPQLQEKVGVGMTADEFAFRAESDQLGHVGLRQSAYLIATRLGWRNPEYAEHLVPVIALEDTETHLGPVRAGAVLGQQQSATLRADQRHRLRLELDMYAGAEGEDRIEIYGAPSISYVVPGGVNGDVATVALMTNLVRVLDEARPGLLTMSDVVPLACIPKQVAALEPRAGLSTSGFSARGE